MSQEKNSKPPMPTPTPSFFHVDRQSPPTELNTIFQSRINFVDLIFVIMSATQIFDESSNSSCCLMSPSPAMKDDDDRLNQHQAHAASFTISSRAVSDDVAMDVFITPQKKQQRWIADDSNHSGDYDELSSSSNACSTYDVILPRARVALTSSAAATSVVTGSRLSLRMRPFRESRNFFDADKTTYHTAALDFDNDDMEDDIICAPRRQFFAIEEDDVMVYFVSSSSSLSFCDEMPCSSGATTITPPMTPQNQKECSTPDLSVPRIKNGSSYFQSSTGFHSVTPSQCNLPFLSF
jgi:hypothetical protein